MRTALAGCEVFAGLDDGTLDRITALAEIRGFAGGERPFVLGDVASCFYVVVDGNVDLCVPIRIGGTVEEVALETKGPASALGWSAFVKPHRFRLTARASGDARLAVMQRDRLTDVFAADRAVACEFMERIAELTAARLLTVQALWVRELQRLVEARSHAGAGR